MKVDDPRQHQQAAGVDALRSTALVGADGADVTARDPQRGLVDFVAKQGPAAFDENVSHDAAP